MNWKCAVHTISWANYSFDRILRDVANAGYEGIELFQHPSECGGPEEIIRLCKLYEVTLVGIAGGSFQERCQLVRDIAKITDTSLEDRSLPYVYCDEWRDEKAMFRDAVNSGIRVAIHPHMFKPVQNVQEFRDILSKYPQVLFLPDTAHLTIAGNNPVEAIKEYFKNLAAVHLKSWRADVGRSYQFYARGFCELGHGDVEVKAVLSELSARGFQGWVVVEQDSSSQPCESAIRSRQWLESETEQLRSTRRCGDNF
ncbi:MAG: sugar phosphate isomerase/epimerase [Planctomycetaceae bacterium]|nr:sugar phosphate isomerase/epimerase [Planctomycetaceae bacterium]